MARRFYRASVAGSECDLAPAGPAPVNTTYAETAS
jgi:hypothetical protein